jgi:hypothetical protein
MSSAARTAIQSKELSLPPGNSVAAEVLSPRWAASGPLFVQGVALALAAIAAAECHVVVTHSAPQAPVLPSVLYGLVLWYWWGLTAIVLWELAQKSGKNFFSLSSAIKHACAGVLVAGAHLWLLQQTVQVLTVQWPILGPAGYSSLDYLNLNRFFFELLIYGFIFGLTGVIHLQLAAQRDTMRALSLERQLSVAHLRALQMQIEPHFLFNTLNAITSLVELDRKEQALQTLGNLNSILKSTLRRSAPEKVSLAHELELVDDYLSIEVTRFADRLQVDMTIDPGSLDAQVPCFLLQPIIENAVRHGISQCEESGSIRMSAERNGSRLKLTVRNTVPGMERPGQPGHGIGLKNTQERLTHFYGQNFEFRAGTLPPCSFEVYIDVPYERSSR